MHSYGTDEALVVHRYAGTAAGTIVLLHGLTDSGAGWADAVRRWSPLAAQLVAPDMRGHGESPRWTDAELAGRPGEVMTEDVVALVARAGPAPAVLVGHSMGAAVHAAVDPLLRSWLRPRPPR